MRKKTLLNILPLIALCTLSTGFARADIIATIGEYNGPNVFDFTPTDYPLPSVLIGDFTFTIPAGVSVVGGTISGTFGNDSIPGLTDSTAPSDYFVDNGAIEVASCDDSLSFTDPCDTGSTPTAWSYTLTSTDLSKLSTELAAGSIDFTVTQNFAVAVQTGATTLDLVLSPEPSMLFLLCGGLAGIALFRRFRNA